MKQKVLMLEVLVLGLIALGGGLIGHSIATSDLKTEIRSNRPIIVGEFVYRCGEMERLPLVK